MIKVFYFKMLNIHFGKSWSQFLLQILLSQFGLSVNFSIQI